MHRLALNSRHSLCGLLAAVLLVGSVSCGVATTPFDRLTVTPQLRQQCTNTTEDFIALYIQIAEQNRLAGVSYLDNINAALAACEGVDPSVRQSCANCTVAVMNQVYGIAP